MSEVPPDLRERKWRIQAIGNADWLALSKLFPFSNSEQLEKFMRGVTIIQSALNHHGELSLYEGEDRVRFSTWTMEKENDTIDPITETDLRLARQIETFYTNLMKDGTPKPALFLDFDGTVRDVVEDPARAHKGGFRAPYRPEEVAVYPQVADILELWDEDGYFLVGATNQSGVGRGDLTEAAAVECIEETVNQIGIGFPVFYSTSKKAANYKPRIGMGLAAIEEHGPFDLEESIMVGDNHRGGDENFAHNLGITFIHADDFFHLSKDQRKGRAAETFTSLNSEAFSADTFPTPSQPRRSPCFPEMTLFNKVLPSCADHFTYTQLKEKKVPQLKEMLRERGRVVGGRKSELIERILESQWNYFLKPLSKNRHLPLAFSENWLDWLGPQRIKLFPDGERRFKERLKREYGLLEVAPMSPSLIHAKIEELKQKSPTVNQAESPNGFKLRWRAFWDYLSKNPYLPAEIITQYWADENTSISITPKRNPHIPKEIWKEFGWRSTWSNEIDNNPSLTPEIMLKYWGFEGDESGGMISIQDIQENPSLTPEIIERGWGEWFLRDLLHNHSALTSEIVDRHWNELLPYIRYGPGSYRPMWDARESEVAIWPNLSHTWITPEIIEKGWGHWGRVDSLGHLPALTMELIEKHSEEFNPIYLGKNPNLTPEFINKLYAELHKSGFSASDREAVLHKGLSYLAQNPNPKILAYLLENFPEFTEGANWAHYNMARNPNLTEKLMEKYWDKWAYEEIAQNPNLSPTIIENHWSDLEPYTRKMDRYAHPKIFRSGSMFLDNPSLFPCGDLLGILNWRL